MKLRDIFTTRIRRPWRAFALGVILAICCLLVAQLFQSRVGHDVSADDYATLTFREILTSNGVSYARFTVRNDHEHPLNIHLNNIQIKEGSEWSYYASHMPLPSSPELGNFRFGVVSPGKRLSFLVPTPRHGDAWRINVGVLRGIQGLTLRHRVKALTATWSLSAALSSPPRLMTNYFRFTFAGMLNGPDLPLGNRQRESDSIK